MFKKFMEIFGLGLMIVGGLSILICAMVTVYDIQYEVGVPKLILDSALSSHHSDVNTASLRYVIRYGLGTLYTIYLLLVNIGMFIVGATMFHFSLAPKNISEK